MKKLFVLFPFILLLGLTLSAQTVYVTKSGTKYHNDGCRSLSQSKIAMQLDVAISKGYGPCGICKPSTKASTTSTQKEAPANTIQNEVKTPVNSSTNVASQQCEAITKAGTRCSRKAEAGSKYCWQHKK